jgi:Tetratricopeptide repeat
LTYQRLGQPLPEALLARAGTNPRGDWPRPALAVVAGKLLPEEMLKLLERKGGEERKMASTEGYFYLGRYYMERRDKTKAREYFERALQVNIVTSAEHKAAGFELRDLGAAAPLPHEAITGQGIPTGSLPVASATADGPQANVPSPGSVPPKAKNQKPPGKTPESWTSNLFKGW